MPVVGMAYCLLTLNEMVVAWFVLLILSNLIDYVFLRLLPDVPDDTPPVAVPSDEQGVAAERLALCCSGVATYWRKNRYSAQPTSQKI